MPDINDYICNNCHFSLPQGWGGYLYVIDDNGKRIVCPHPDEGRTIRKILGKKATKQMILDQTGYNSDCVCLNCLHQFELDIGDDEGAEDNNERSVRYYYCKYSMFHSYGTNKRRDQRICPKCKSENVKTVIEMVDKTCPKCKTGIIEKKWTWRVS